MLVLGGEKMYQLNNNQFGDFIVTLRKEKNLTQKELGEKLYVTDKTVSKWERGLSIPNVALLVPLSEILDVSVTELLYGQRLEEPIDKKVVEHIVNQSIDLNMKQSINSRKKLWSVLFVVSLVLTILLSYLFNKLYPGYIDKVMLIPIVMLIMAFVFIFFIKDTLPKYYDENKINYYSNGILRMHMVGLSFNNSNWSYISIGIKCWTLISSIVYPIICLMITMIKDINYLLSIQQYLVAINLLGFIILIYILGKKYE